MSSLSATLENSFVRLEPLAERHRAPLRAAGEDPDLWRFATVNQHGTDFDAWINARLAAMKDQGEVTFAVFDKARADYVGSSSFLSVEPAHKRVEIGWTWYAKSAWGGAVNPACKIAMMSHAFGAAGYHRVEFKLDATNKRSWAAVEKLGAQFEGVHRAHLIMADGRVRDTAWFSVLFSEWPAVRAGLGARLEAFAVAQGGAPSPTQALG